MQIAWPLIINSGSFALLNFFDRLFLSWYGIDAFRASLPGGILFFTLVCGFMALTGITNTFVAQLWGKEDRRGCARATTQGMILTLLSLPFIALLEPVGLLLLNISGHPPEVLALEAEYFSILMWGGGGIVLSSAISSFFSGRGCTRTVMGCNLLANGLNILMNYWFVFGGLGLPAMGIAGAGWASVIGCWSAPLFFAISYFNRSHRREFGTLEELRLDRDLLKRMLRFGLPAGFHLFTEVSAFTVFVLLIGRLGDIAHIAGNMALSINLIAFMPMVGMGIAASILVGQYLGRKEPQEAAKCGWMALRVGTGYIASIGLTFLVIPDLYLQLFMPEEVEVDALALREAVYQLLRILAVWGIADAAALILSGALKGAGDTHFVMRYHAACAWGMLVPGQLLLILYFKVDHLVSWAWTLLYVTLLGGGYTWRFFSGRWKEIKLLEDKNRLPPLSLGADAESL